MTSKIGRILKILLFVAGAAILAVIFAAAYLLVLGASKDIHNWKAPENFRVDAGHLNPTPVTQVIMVSPDTAMALRQIRAALKRAHREGLKIAISGARHSMGGQTVFPQGIVLDMLECNRMELDSSGGDKGQPILHVQSGARWADVIPYLDARGYAVAIMQSNNPFSVGGTLSVNAHGWQQNRPPFVSSVAGFHLVGADGIARYCSREQSPELFHLAAGGYGLFGVILGIDLRVIPNVNYRAERFKLTASEYPARFHEWVDGDSTVGLAYGRLSIAPSSFLKKALLTRYLRVPSPPALLAPRSAGNKTMNRVTHWLFLASVENGFGKEARWLLENLFGGESANFASRNTILNDPIDVFDNHDSTRTQLLHEYFVPRDSLESFLARARRIIPGQHGNLLNLTVRNLEPDTDAFMNYARQSVFSLVMLFSQPVTEQGEADMTAMTRKLIDAALDAGGTYYLPYRLHATPEQFLRGYPQAQKYFELKRKYDPEEVFQNRFYLEYGKTKKG